VLPDVIAHDGEIAVGERVVLVGGGDNLELAALGAHQPHPAATEQLGAGIVELLLEIGEAAKSLFDSFGDFAGWLAAALGFHDAPEHAVVHVAAAIVAHGGADVFGNAVYVLQ
jgi:hypothetical protein